MANSYIERHKSWQKYAKEELKKGKKPIPFKHWRTDLKKKPKKSMESVYFRGIKKPTVESQLSKAGVNWEKDKPSARYKRSRKK